MADPMLQNPASSLIFGTAGSTTLTVFAVPILHYVDPLRRRHEQVIVSPAPVV
jgi:hypothetical protein